MASNGRTAEQVQREIEAERDQLAGAVDQLRGEIGHVTDVAGKVKQRLPLVAGAAATLGFVIAGGIGATMRYAARRGRESE
jgi:Protein of unknown function (DUF3618)